MGRHDMSVHSDTLSWFLANQFLLFTLCGIKSKHSNIFFKKEVTYEKKTCMQDSNSQA